MSQPFSLQQLQALCDVAIQAALAAGEFIQNTDRTNLKSAFKQAGSSAASQLVTEVDTHSEAIIREHLKPASEELGIGFLGEECSTSTSSETPDHLGTSHFWCVDPLDGTLPFVEGRPGYAVSIALVTKSGNPLIGVVYDPVDSTLTHAIKGQGAYLNGSLLKKERSTSKSLVVFADASFKTHEKYETAIEALKLCAKHSGLQGLTFEYGSGAVKNACQVLQSSAACYLKLPKAEDGGGSVWDFAATACIASEAGAWVSNVHGQPLELNRRDSLFMNDQGVLYASSEQLAWALIGDRPRF